MNALGTGGRVCFTLIAIQHGVWEIGYPLRSLNRQQLMIAAV